MCDGPVYPGTYDEAKGTAAEYAFLQLAEERGIYKAGSNISDRWTPAPYYKQLSIWEYLRVYGQDRKTEMLLKLGLDDLITFRMTRGSLHHNWRAKNPWDYLRINKRYLKGLQSSVYQMRYLRVAQMATKAKEDWDEEQRFGTRKLGIMLTLPEEITEELTPEYTVEDIETIQQEVKEEEQITPLEFLAEQNTSDFIEDGWMFETLKKILEEQPELFARTFGKDEEERKKMFCPVEDTMYICRVPGLGKFMVKLKESGITITEARSLTKEHPTWQQFEEAFAALSQRANSQEPEKAWEEVYGREYPKEEPKKEVKEQKIPEKPQKTEKKKESKVKVTKNAKKDKPKTAAAVKHEEADGRVPESETAEERPVDDIQPEGSRGTDSTSGEADLGGTEGESLSSGTGETLSGESTGASGGEGVVDSAPERNKYSARLENLIYQSKMLEKEISEYKDYQGATKTAKNIEQCIHAIIADLEQEEPGWKEVKE